MKNTLAYILAIACVAPAYADTPAEQIRTLYAQTAQDRIKASPQADILAHIEGMRQRQGGEGAFAIPDLDIDLLMKGSVDQDPLMNPRILEALAMMPPDRAGEALRLIEQRRSGHDLVDAVPPLSGNAGEGEPQILPLEGWVLARDENGAPFIQNGTDPASRLLVVPGMILGDLGRVISVQDDSEAFRITLEGGDRLDGQVRLPIIASDGDSQAEEESAPDADKASTGAETIGSAPTTVEAVETPAVVSSLRPKARPEGLMKARSARSDPTTPILDPARVEADLKAPHTGALTSSPRPRPRPEGLGSGS